MLAKQVKKYRKQKGWTQQKLAEKTSLSFNTITKIEQGIGDSPTLKTLLKLAEAFGVSLDALVGRNK